MKGLSEMTNGADPRESLDQAIHHLQLSLQANPKFALAHEHLGVTKSILGEYQIKRGIDPSASLQSAVENYEAAILSNPGIPDLYLNLGEAFRHRVRYSLLVGQDPSEFVNKALAQFKKAADLNPEMAEAYSNQGAVLALETELHLLQGKDLDPAAESALQSFSKAQQLNPQYFESYVYGSDVYWVEARHQLDGGKSPVDSLEKARAALKRALEIQPDASEALWRRAQINLLQLEWNAFNHSDSGNLPGAIQSDLEAAMKKNPEDGRIDLLLAESYLWRSGADLEEGIRIADQALAKNPLLAQATGLKGMFHLRLARSAQGSQRQLFAGKAFKEFTEAVKQNRFLENQYAKSREEAGNLVRKKS